MHKLHKLCPSPHTLLICVGLLAALVTWAHSFCPGLPSSDPASHPACAFSPFYRSTCRPLPVSLCTVCRIPPPSLIPMHPWRIPALPFYEPPIELRPLPIPHAPHLENHSSYLLYIPVRSSHHPVFSLVQCLA